MRNICFSLIQPRSGWEIISVHNPAFHAGPLRLNPFGICDEVNDKPVSGKDKNLLCSQPEIKPFFVYKAEEIKERMFLSFFTTKPTRQGKALELYLSLSYDIVTKVHAIILKIESTYLAGSLGLPARGTEFSVTIPTK